MPDLLTPQALATAGPLVLETFFKHFLGSKHAKDESAARGDDLMYDEAFVLMKTFLEIATKYPVAALQRFGLVRTPAPPWVALHRVLIPQRTLVQSAEYLIKAFGGEEMAYKVAGGTKWWQIRAGPGVEGEWIVMKKDWKEMSGVKREDGVKETSKEVSAGNDASTNQNGEFRREMDELRCMLYIHGGAYYWGSINTHRYTIWRYARKMHGRCFAVNYRKAPQYPFPCAIQDCLAAWLYLVDPPPGAKHKPVDPKNIVIAGDSAGGGLVWALLQILRDTQGLELPAGAVLISPWSDLTHSFPSILNNTATDIVPPYGFIHKPSSLWPPPPPALTDAMQNRLRSRVKEAVTRMKTDGPHPDGRPRGASIASQGETGVPVVQKPTEMPKKLYSSSPDGGAPGSGKDGKTRLHPVTEGNDEEHHPGPKSEPHPNPSRVNPGILFSQLAPRDKDGKETGRATTLTQCYTPLQLDVEGEPVVIDTQIQLVATNAQLSHPWVSPIVGYLGGLPPLLIIAGNNEVLRDEIIYAAHKAAHPKDHPIRDDVRQILPSLEGIEERYSPTDVHLQVYDGVCHDLPLFSMTKPARGLFRAIASFARQVTASAPGSLSISRSQQPSPSRSGVNTPEYIGDSQVKNAPTLDLPPAVITTPTTLSPNPSSADLTRSGNELSKRTDNDVLESPLSMNPGGSRKSSGPSLSTIKMTRFETSSSSKPDGTDSPSPYAARSHSMSSGDDAGPRFRAEDLADRDSRAAPGTAGHSGIYRGANPFKDHMIRERVATDGHCRHLEPAQELPAMTMPLDEVGVIKEGPAIRYLNGQSLWDKKFSHALKAVDRHRKRNLTDAKERDTRKIMRMWQKKMKLHQQERARKGEEDGSDEDEEEQADWETTDHEDEHEHGHEHETGKEEEMGKGNKVKGKGKGKSAGEDLMDQSWSWSWALEGEAPPPSAIVSRRDFGEARQLALMADRMDTNHESPISGLSIWVGLAAFFSNSSDRTKAHAALTKAQEEKRTDEMGKTDKADKMGTMGKVEKAGKAEHEGGRKRDKAKGAIRKMSSLLGLRKKSGGG